MFRRRTRRQIHEAARSLVWPRSGFRRAIRYVMHRVARLPGSPYSIAAGFACGAAMSFTPLIGLHFVLSAIVAWLIGGNVIASAIGTVVGNPWTFPFIWIALFKVGSAMLGTDPAAAPVALSLGHLVDHPWSIFLPMLVGSIPLAAAAWIVSYVPLKAAVATYQAHRRRRLGRARSRLEPAVRTGDR